jgi:hypothetical protein
VTESEWIAAAAFAIAAIAVYILNQITRQLGTIQIEIRTLRQELRELLHEEFPDDPRGSHAPYLDSISRKLSSVSSSLDMIISQESEK